MFFSSDWQTLSRSGLENSHSASRCPMAIWSTCPPPYLLTASVEEILVGWTMDGKEGRGATLSQAREKEYNIATAKFNPPPSA
ncbi:hypothetical protein SLE2022_033730 [Rubroshorea leprosula]